jgi:hypothetical protein
MKKRKPSWSGLTWVRGGRTNKEGRPPFDFAVMWKKIVHGSRLEQSKISKPEAYPGR